MALDYRGPEDEYRWRARAARLGRGRGLPWLRTATHKLPSLKRLIEEVDADVYYIRGAHVVSRWVIAGAHALDAPALLGLASDRNLLPESGRTLVPFGRGPVGRRQGSPGLARSCSARRCARRTSSSPRTRNRRRDAPGWACRTRSSPASSSLRRVSFWSARPTTTSSGRATSTKAASRRKGVEPLLGARAGPCRRCDSPSRGPEGPLRCPPSSPELRESPNVDLRRSPRLRGVQALIARSRLVLNTSPDGGLLQRDARGLGARQAVGDARGQPQRVAGRRALAVDCASGAATTRGRSAPARAAISARCRC